MLAQATLRRPPRPAARVPAPRVRSRRMPVTGTGVRPVTSARRLSVAASRAGPGSTWAPVCRPDSGWAGTNQNIFHAIPHLSWTWTLARQCTAQPADPPARGTGQGLAFICGHALHKSTHMAIQVDICESIQKNMSTYYKHMNLICKHMLISCLHMSKAYVKTYVAI